MTRKRFPSNALPALAIPNIVPPLPLLALHLLLSSCQRLPSVLPRFTLLDLLLLQHLVLCLTNSLVPIHIDASCRGIWSCCASVTSPFLVKTLSTSCVMPHSLHTLTDFTLPYAIALRPHLLPPASCEPLRTQSLAAFLDPLIHRCILNHQTSTSAHWVSSSATLRLSPSPSQHCPRNIASFSWLFLLASRCSHRSCIL